jgi:hypothetical protein
MQGIAAAVLGPERARAILEWEAVQNTILLRVGAAVAIAGGGFVALAMTRPRVNRKAP